ncbi:MAG: hypothetical protein ACOC1F_09385, partial [Myxococcota bacterium]
MPLLPPNIDYTDKDFDALRERLIALLKSVFPEWSDFSVASFGNILLEMYAFVGDVITYYLDAQAQESRLATATQRRNVIALARMLGYKLQGARAARATVRFSLQAPPAADVTLPAGTVVRTQEVTEPIRFQLLAPLVIAAGTTPPVASAKCIELLKESAVDCVLGNHDRWLLRGTMRDLPDAIPVSALRDHDPSFLSSLPKTRTYHTSRGRLMLCHGMRDDDMGALLADDEGYALESNFELQELIVPGRHGFVVAG